MSEERENRRRRNIFAVVVAVVATVVLGPVGGKIGSWLAGSALGATWGSIAFRAALGIALGALSEVSQPRVATRGYQVTQRGTALNHQIIYGKTKAAGAIVFDSTTGTNNKYLHRVIAMTGHEIESFEEIWLNDYKLTLDSNGEVTSATNDGGLTTTTRYNGYVRINKHLGTATQTADSDLVSEVTEWDSNCTLNGIAYLYCRLKFSQEVFPNGIPEIQATIKGKKVYDPRDVSQSATDASTWTWSDNPALCIRDYIHSDYGLNEDNANIDDDLVEAAADRCDETATNGDAFFTMNGAFTTGTVPADVLSDMLTAMGGVLWYGQGEWRMRAAEWTAPTLTLDENDLRSPLTVSTRHSRRDNFNVIKGTWRGEGSDWQVTDYPEYKVAQAVTDDGGEESVQDLQLPFTDNVDEAQRIARITYERNRQQLTVSATFGLSAFNCQVGDFIQFNYDRMGWTSAAPKYWEVTEWSFGIVNEDLLVNMTLREVSASVFDEISNYETYEKDNTTLASPFDAQDVSVATPVASSSLNGDGTVVPKLKWTWSVTDESDVDYYIFGWRIGASGTYNEFVVKEKQFEIEPAVAGAAYYYTVKAVNHLGVAGSASTGNITAVNDTTAPATPTGLTATAGYGSITLSWDQPSETDFRHVKVQVSDDNSTFTDLGYSSGTGFVHGGIADSTTKYYKVRAEDYSGNTSSYTTSVNATTLEAPAGADGARGAGRWYISVTTLPTNSSAANSAFTADVGAPVDRDQAWFYTGTIGSPTAQNVWIYNETTDTWNEQEEVIDGDLIVAGTITTDRINIDTLLQYADGAGFASPNKTSADESTVGAFWGNPSGAGSFVMDVVVKSTANVRRGLYANDTDGRFTLWDPAIQKINPNAGTLSTIVVSASSTITIPSGVTSYTIIAVGGGGGGGGGNDVGATGGNGGTGGTTTAAVSGGSTYTGTGGTGGAGGGGSSGAGSSGGTGANGPTISGINSGNPIGTGGLGGAFGGGDGSDGTGFSSAGGGGGGRFRGDPFYSNYPNGLGGSAGNVTNSGSISKTSESTVDIVITIGAGGTGGAAGSGSTGAGGAGSSGVVYVQYQQGDYLETFLPSTSEWNAVSGASDRDLKQHIANMPSVNAILAGMKPKTFEFVDTYKYGEGTRYGFIAQELQTIAPDLVYDSEEGGHLSIRYLGIIAILVKGYQEQEIKIAQQQALITAMEDRITALEN